MDRLQKLKDRTEAASYAEVIRNALRLFEALVDPRMMMPFFTSKLGIGLMVLAGILEVIGALIIRKIVDIKV